MKVIDQRQAPARTVDGLDSPAPGGLYALSSSWWDSRAGQPSARTHTMAAAVNRQVLLRRRPSGAPTPADFEITESPIPEAREGEILCRTIYLSLDPYMRGRMNEGRSYAASVELGQVMVGGTVSEVIESKSPAFPKGDFVAGYDGWQAYA